MTSRSKLILYILLNIVVSAATTLTVLFVWDYTHKIDPVVAPQASMGAVATLPAVVNNPPAANPVTATPETGNQPAVYQPTLEPTGTLPPAGEPVIQIVSVVGAGDAQSEVVLLKRVGTGNVRMVGWKLVSEDGSIGYTFPEQPELILYQDGAVQVHTGAGDNTATDVYWNRTDPAWKPGELIKLLDDAGAERATYRVP